MENAKLMDLAALLLVLPRRKGKPLHRSTIYRWVYRGIKTADGVVKLACVRIGGDLFFAPEAVSEFISALSQSKRSTGSPGSSGGRSPAARKQASAGAGEAIDARYGGGRNS
jgi:hypothetical protein